MVHRQLSRSIPDASPAQLGDWDAGRLRLCKVDGHSMTPSLQPGDGVLVDPLAYRDTPPAPGEVVLCRHPHQTDLWMVKRVRSRDAEGRLELVGDHAPASTDSRMFGAVPPALVSGRVVARIRPRAMP